MAKTTTDTHSTFKGNVVTGEFTNKSTTKDEKGNSSAAYHKDPDEAARLSQDGLKNQTELKKKK
jgi:hypothetical protein